uniref:Uncharacterized protein n=1 Tax=Hyaloperonospora arabidopsidis (strain Emoy2) TaxID=559515 RepID=M4BIN5_HYAAE
MATDDSGERFTVSRLCGLWFLYNEHHSSQEYFTISFANDKILDLNINTHVFKSAKCGDLLCRRRVVIYYLSTRLIIQTAISDK